MSIVNREKIEAWVKALRSGYYKQVRGALEINNKMCCLGVYCRIHGIEYNAQVVEGGDSTSDEFVDAWEEACQADNVHNEDAYNQVMRELFDAGLDAYIYINMNDNDGATFREIANVIEMHLKETDRRHAEEDAVLKEME